MRQYGSWSVRLVRQVVRRRWWVMLAAGLAFIILQATAANLNGGNAPDYWAVAFGGGVCLPMAGGVLLGLVGRAMLEERLHAARYERRRITRDLHDNLGQHIAYLRLKLDALAVTDPSSVTARDLAQMRSVANDAYREVRAMLQQLDVKSEADITAALVEHANVVAQRACLRVDVTTEGVPRPLDAQTREQILYIFREALANVERHADATHVQLRLTWGPHALTILLQDDGRGFRPADPLEADHLGLGIMRERAAEIGALLTVTSYPGSGTLVLFRQRHSAGLIQRLADQLPVKALHSQA